MELCAGMGKAGLRSNPGVNVAIPIGIALKKLVLAARNQREAKLAPKLKMPLVTSSAAAEIEMKGLFDIFQAF